jgi:hypothetical protein
MCKQLKWLQKRVKVHFPFSQERILYSEKVLKRRFVNNKYLMVFIEDEKTWDFSEGICFHNIIPARFDTDEIELESCETLHLQKL